jgi:hypothetical protein
MLKPLCICKRAGCIGLCTLALLTDIQDHVVADDGYGQAIEAQPAPGSLSAGAVVGPPKLTFLPIETRADGDPKYTMIADWTVTSRLNADKGSDLDDFWNLIKPKS